MQNRYLREDELELLLDEARRKFTYSPPTPARIKEHEQVNAAILEAVNAIINTCPDTHETELAVDYLWIARACANGALATFNTE